MRDVVRWGASETGEALRVEHAYLLAGEFIGLAISLVVNATFPLSYWSVIQRAVSLRVEHARTLAVSFMGVAAALIHLLRQRVTRLIGLGSRPDCYCARSKCTLLRFHSMLLRPH